jgi:nicotinic acid mononucleotide adenylyltransferase
MRELSLDEVLFVIPEVPPHKDQLEASLEERVQMLLRAIGEEPHFSAAVSTHGLFRDIGQALVPHYPSGTKVLFLTGRDAAERILLRWPYADPRKALAEMFAGFDFGVADRGGRFDIPADSLAAPYAAQIHCFKIGRECEGISARLVRQHLARGESIKEFVPTEVEAFIRQRALYGCGPP